MEECGVTAEPTVTIFVGCHLFCVSLCPGRSHLCAGLLLPRTPEMTIFVLVTKEVTWGGSGGVMFVCLPHMHTQKEPDAAMKKIRGHVYTHSSLQQWRLKSHDGDI